MTKNADKIQTTQDILPKKEIEALKEKLVSERARIMALYDQDVRAGKQSAQEGTDDLVDRANSAYNRELMFSLSNTEREQLFEIDDALKRIENGTYGFCEYSGEPIKIERLKALPWARYSVVYQEMAEQGLLDL